MHVDRGVGVRVRHDGEGGAAEADSLAAEAGGSYRGWVEAAEC